MNEGVLSSSRIERDRLPPRPRVTAESFYRRALALPVVLPLAATAILFLTEGWEEPTVIVYPVLSVAGFLMLAGVWSAIPYAAFLVVVFLFRKRLRSAQQMRKVAWTAPGAIAVVFATCHAVPALADGRWRAAGALFAFWGALAALTGYGYVAIIETALDVARRRGLVTP